MAEEVGQQLVARCDGNVEKQKRYGVNPNVPVRRPP